MKTILSRLSIMLVLLVMTTTATAKSYTVADVPNVQLKDSRQRVSDPEALLGGAARDTINVMLAELKQKTGIEVAVVMLPSIGEADIFDFAHELFRTWGIGNKKTNGGMLILYVDDIHRLRFTTGYGIEGTMTDAMTKRIATRYMVPRFKEGNTDQGMIDGIKASCDVLDGSMQPEPEEEEEDIPWYVAVTIVTTMIALFMFFIWLVDHINKRCPYCKKSSLKRITSNVIKKGARTYRHDTFICQNCGKVVTKDHDITPNDNNNLANGIIIGSMLGGGRRGGGFSGGGFSGGSWGGGSTGGGGSTSGW
ncbi:MAG: TPM domain-containing protein [Prevotellaceae bacterium]|nr:TPM domain-containing protein [Prevotellaceae bacterium]